MVERAFGLGRRPGDLGRHFNAAAKAPELDGILSPGALAAYERQAHLTVLKGLLGKLADQGWWSTKDQIKFLRSYRCVNAFDFRELFKDLQTAKGRDVLRVWQKAKYQDVPQLVFEASGKDKQKSIDELVPEIEAKIDGTEAHKGRDALLRETCQELRELQAELKAWPKSHWGDTSTFRFEVQIHGKVGTLEGIPLAGAHLGRIEHRQAADGEAEDGGRELDWYLGAGARGLPFPSTGPTVLVDAKSGRTAIEFVVRTPGSPIAVQFGALYPGGGLTPAEVVRIRLLYDFLVADGYIVPPGLSTDGTAILNVVGSLLPPPFRALKVGLEFAVGNPQFKEAADKMQEALPRVGAWMERRVSNARRNAERMGGPAAPSEDPAEPSQSKPSV
jgi:hypothetical protein